MQAATCTDRLTVGHVARAGTVRRDSWSDCPKMSRMAGVLRCHSVAGLPVARQFARVVLREWEQRNNVRATGVGAGSHNCRFSRTAQRRAVEIPIRSGGRGIEARRRNGESAARHNCDTRQWPLFAVVMEFNGGDRAGWREVNAIPLVVGSSGRPLAQSARYSSMSKNDKNW
jgi:hypothetical protein